MIVVALFIAAQCSGAACPNPCTACAFQPEQGSDPSPSEYQDLFRAIAQRQGAADLPSVDNLETGAARTRSAAEFPCTLMPAVGATESSITEFCSGNGLTVISFDCGFGVMQVTSGASGYPGLESRADINIAAGADILATKWNDQTDFGGTFGDSDASIIESWYFAVWAYNGFVYGNNPNNPSFDANRPPFRSPGTLSRGSYPYQELVWGFLQFPLQKGGADMWTGVDVTYPNRSDIPNQSGLFSVAIALPDPAHNDSCVEQCPPSGCPPVDQRTLILDDADATFTVDGAVNDDATGGFADHFFDVATAPAGSPTVQAHWEGIAPSSGTFNVAGFIPIDPATCNDIHVVVHARGAPKEFSLDQSAIGGDFQSLGQVVLAAGALVTVDVDNGTNDPDTTHRIGLDAFRFAWLGDGAVSVGDTCSDDVDCAGDALCIASACADPCDVAGCATSEACTASGLCAAEGEGEGTAGEGEGAAGEGEGAAGEGEGEPGHVVTPPAQGCTCATSTTLDGAALAALAAFLARARRRRTGFDGAENPQLTPSKATARARLR